MKEISSKNQPSISHQILMQKQYSTVLVVDETTGDERKLPRFVMRGLKMGTGSPQERIIYFDGNKNFDAMRSKTYNVNTVVSALNLQARIMSKYADELKIFDNAAPKDEQLVFHYVSGVGQLLKERWNEYITYQKF